MALQSATVILYDCDWGFSLSASKQKQISENQKDFESSTQMLTWPVDQIGFGSKFPRKNRNGRINKMNLKTHQTFAKIARILGRKQDWWHNLLRE